MANITYLKSATDENYQGSAFTYISGLKEGIIDVANIIGISAGAIAGAMAEENTAYDNYDYALDLYAKSDIGKGSSPLLTLMKESETHPSSGDSKFWGQDT